MKNTFHLRKTGPPGVTPAFAHRVPRSLPVKLTCVVLGAYIPLAFITAALAAPLDQATLEAQYQAALSAYRAGHLAEGYAQLHALHLAFPANLQLRNDYIAVASDTGHQGEALVAAAGSADDSFPPYVLDALGRAARNEGKPDLAVRYFSASLAKGDDVAAEVGRDLALIDQKKAEVARVDLIRLNSAHPRRVDVLEALGLANEALNRPIDALANAQALLLIEPGHAGGLQLRYRTLIATGSPRLALELTPLDALSADQRIAGRRETLAYDFRWARDAPITDMQRGQRLDAVILEMQGAVDTAASNPGEQTQQRDDLVVALVERGRVDEAIALYQQSIAGHPPVAPYVLGAITSAYLTAKQPEQAIRAFESLPDREAVGYGAKASYFYALLESGRYDAALAWADHVLATEPMYNYANFPELRTPNPDYGKALVLAGVARSYTDRLAAGQSRLASVTATAPDDGDARLALAITYELRGWPREANDVAVDVRRQDPESTAPLSQMFADRLQMSDWRGASEALSAMHAVIPVPNSDLTVADRNWQLHQMPELVVEGQLGRSYGGRAGLIDSQIDEKLYSAPIAWDWRAYLHLNQAQGDPIQGELYRHAVGAGVEYHTPLWLLTGELVSIDGRGLYPQFSADLSPNDFWTFGASLAQHTLETPIAATAVGVTADHLELRATYRASESQEFGAIAGADQFSDGNQRRDLAGFWQQRWVTGPVYKFDTRLDLESSQNSLAETNYFNPSRDATGVITLKNQWLQFRHYDQSLSHEVDIGLGNYWQRGYGNGSVASLAYQLVYDVNDQLVLKAGLGRTLRPYDGERERLDALTFSLDGRF